MSRRRFRPRPPFAPRHEVEFRWRGHEVSRLEGLTDAVFAFAVTLLVVALEVPHTFEGLMDVVRNLPAFVICFVLLMVFWTAHYQYFRRYGLEDGLTRFLTMGILVLVLFAVYPLKFLFTLVTANLFQLHLANTPHLETMAEVRTLYLIYGLGFAGVWLLYTALYGHALSRRHELQLTPAETIETRASLWSCMLYVLTSVASIALAYGSRSDVAPGFVYCALAPLQLLNRSVHRRQKNALLHRERAPVEV
jgi:uncharacterized membrane protein